MFQKILQWIKGVIEKMIGQTSVKNALKVDIAISAPMAAALQLWSQMYENKADWLSKDIKSLNLASAVAGEIAKAVTLEMGIELSGSARADWLAEQFKPVLAKLREKVEVGCAKGGLMIKPFISGKGLAFDFVQADQFYPVSFDASGNITACVFADQRTIGEKYYTRLEMHQMTAEGCLIKNMAFVSNSQESLGTQVGLESVAEWAELLPEATIQNIDRPLYAYFRFPAANNVDPTSPLGVSCYSRATDLIKQADEIWSNLMWEFESGKRAIYVDPLAFGKDANGRPLLPDKRLFRTVDLGGSRAIGDGSSEDMFHDWTPEFREASIISGLDAVLKKIEYQCGLAYGTISDPNVEAKTATEVTTTRQRTYATITDTRKALQKALEDLIWAMDVWATLAGLSPKGTYSTAYNFDDSVIVDKDAQFKQDLQLVGSRIMGRVEFRMRNFGEDEATAKKKIAAIDAEMPQEEGFFQGG